jgi:hypothetical protein
MKTKAIVAGLVGAAAALVTVYVVRRRKQKKLQPVHRSHHLTEIFSAKAHSK